MNELEAALDMKPVLKRHLEQHFGSIVRVDPSSSEIRLVHASARDYLMSIEAGLLHNASASEPVKLISIHSDIPKRCLEYLVSYHWEARRCH